MQLIFPPGGIILAIFLIFLLFLFNKKKLATFFAILLIFFLFLFSSWFGEYILLRPLEDDYSTLQKILNNKLNLSNPVIVVLGGGLIENSLAEKTGKPEIGEVTLARLYGAYGIYREIQCPIWVSGGSVPGYSGNVSSAEIMEEVLIKMGVSPNNVFQESESRTTYENAIFTIEEIRKQGYQEVILVTSALHMRRSVQSFESNKVTIIPAPVNYLFENTKPGLLNILPNRFSFEHNLRALHEWIGLLYYKIFYSSASGI
ncbi:MAG: YdcF family protein [Elusimicrobiota bacterium]